MYGLGLPGGGGIGFYFAESIAALVLKIVRPRYHEYYVNFGFCFYVLAGKYGQQHHQQ